MILYVPRSVVPNSGWGGKAGSGAGTEDMRRKEGLTITPTTICVELADISDYASGGTAFTPQRDDVGASAPARVGLRP